MPRNHHQPSAATIVANTRQLSRDEIRELQDQHNVNLHADGEGDDYLDADEDLAGLTIMCEDEFFLTYCE